VGLLGNKDFMETPFSTISYTDTYIQDLAGQGHYRRDPPPTRRCSATA
jgi:hypothetical protein